jgi:hypothetical protein
MFNNTRRVVAKSVTADSKRVAWIVRNDSNRSTELDDREIRETHGMITETHSAPDCLFPTARGFVRCFMCFVYFVCFVVAVSEFGFNKKQKIGPGLTTGSSGLVGICVADIFPVVAPRRFAAMMSNSKQMRQDRIVPRIIERAGK